MRRVGLLGRSITFHWRTHLATGLCAAVAATALTGSLIVGDSMRGSLRQNALARIGRIDHALLAGRFFREDLADEIDGDDSFKRRFDGACPAILAPGAVERPDSASSARQVSIFGVDDRFWRLTAGSSWAPAGSDQEGTVVLTTPLADRLGVRPGEDVLVRLGAAHPVPVETLLGRAGAGTASLRLTVARIIPDEGPGGLDLSLTQRAPLNAFIPLPTLQRELKQRGRANAILVAGAADRSEHTGEDAMLERLLAAKLRLADAGLSIREDGAEAGIVLDSERLLIEPAIEAAAFQAARNLQVPATGVLTYLANSIALAPPEPPRGGPGPSTATASFDPKSDIPYSTVTAIGAPADGAALLLTLIDGSPAPPLLDEDLLLNEWAASELNVAAGDRVRLTYFVAGAFGGLSTESAVFAVRGIVAMRGVAVDRTLAPDYEGVTDARSLADWDPPFPMDLKRIRNRDEEYWKRYGPAPKAFVGLQAGQRLWTQTQSRFGQLTSVRLGPVEGKPPDALSTEFERELLSQLPPAAVGLTFEPIRARALAASRGSTDFSMLFLAFSIFLIASAVLLVVLIFRLGMERRASEVGLLLAVGMTRRSVAWQLCGEAAGAALPGVTIGLVCAVVYAHLMIAGLRSWWSGAVHADFLRVHIEGRTLLVGWAVTTLVTLLSTAWSIRGLSCSSPRALLAGQAACSATVRGSFRAWLAIGISVGGFVLAAALVTLSALRTVPTAVAFFGSGAALLVSAMAATRVYLRQPQRQVIRAGGAVGMVRLGIRNAARNPLRTLLTTALIASAAFIITAVGANRREAVATSARSSGTGGCSLVAESAVPVVQDLNTAGGQESLTLSRPVQDLLAVSRVVPFRLRPGDEASCLNLYRTGQPRVLGATDGMIERGGFAFRASLARTPEERANPWLLLNRQFDDGAMPVIGDDSTVTWLLHLGLGDDLVQRGERGQEFRLRVVGLLAGSILQSELVIAEPRFVEQFPSMGGYRFFLVDAPADRAQDLAAGLERDLHRYGLQVDPATSRLGRYLAVENAYLSAFQTLGGLGMVLGTLGLGAVLWRSVLDRRGELALLRALGFSRAHLRWMVWGEHAAVLLWGTGAGAVSGLVAVAPEIASGHHATPWGGVGVTLLGILAGGGLSLAAGLFFGLRAQLLPSLRND